MRRLTTASLLALVVLGIFGSRAASAQQQVSFSVGGFSPRSEDARASSDVLVNNLDFLAFRISDFGGPLFGAEYVTGLGDNFDAGLGVGFYQRTVPSVYSNLTYPDGGEIRQDLKLRTVPITGIVRFVPTGRHAPIQPYLGIGIAAINWHYSETGDFVDTGDNTIFSARYVDSGTEIAPIYLGGVRAPMGGRFLVGGEIRYQHADAPLDPNIDFVGSRLDLGGWSYLGTMTWKF